MKKIAIFIPNLRGGGAERVFVNLAHSFLNKGYEVDFILIQEKGELLSVLPKSVNVVNLNASRIIKSFLPLKKYLQEEKPDALVAVMWPLTILATVAAKITKFRGKLILSDHNTLSLSTKEWPLYKRKILSKSIKYVYPIADTSLVVSDGVADDLSNFTGLDRTNLTVIYNPIFVQDINTDKLQTKIIDKNSKYRIINLGALSEQKNQALLIKAFSKIVDKIDAELVILGDGVLKDNLKKLISELGLEDKVLMAGFITDPSPWYKQSDLFVLSSIYEGLPMVLLEALTFGLPIVATNCKSGPKEILSDGKYGRLVPINDADALAQAMIESLQTEHDTDALKLRAADFAVDEIAEQYLDIMFPERL